MLQCQLYMESHHSKYIKSIMGHFYNIPPILGSFQPVLTSPDTEIEPKTAPGAQNLASTFLHQYMVQSGHKNSVEQPFVCPRIYPNSAQFTVSFLERWALQVGHYCWKRDITEILICQLFMESQHSKCIESIKRHF